MRIESPGVKVENMMPYEECLLLLESFGRVCYKSESQTLGTDEEKVQHAEAFVSRLIDRGHESVLEHINVSMRIICDRGASHEIVRHRIASYTQESTRYCNYAKDKFGKEITVIKPPMKNEDMEQHWMDAMLAAEKAYLAMLDAGATPEIARSVLPHATKVELVMTMNLREWRHFIRMRAAKDAHPQVRQIAMHIYNIFSRNYPVIVGDITMI